jgi:hypothetical protein
MNEKRRKPRRSLLLISLAVLFILWLATTGTGGLFVFSSNRSPISGTFDSITQTEEFDMVKSVKFTLWGREHRFVLWTTREKGTPSLIGVEEE